MEFLPANNEEELKMVAEKSPIIKRAVQKLEKITELIDEGKYLTINRARQFGKTTTLELLFTKMSDEYFVIPISFEGVGDEMFSSPRVYMLL